MRSNIGSAGAWPIVKLADIASTIQYGYTASAAEKPVGPRFLRITDIQDNRVDWDTVPYCKVATKERSKYLLKQGDIVFARTGATVGKSFLIKEKIPESVFASYLIRVQLKAEVEARYIDYFFKSPQYWSQISESRAGIGQPNVNGTKLSQLRIPLAPIEQQRSIVAEIEKQFSRLDEAVAGLKRVKANLKRYKAAVLKAAVEGRLVETEAEFARREGRSCETGEQLLKRILEERRRQWKGKGKYKEPAAPDPAGLPELPEGWVWGSIERLTAELMNGYGKRSQAKGKPRIVLRLADIVNGEISYKDVRRINCTDDEIRKYMLIPNDLLILRVNGSPDLVGRVVLVRQASEETLFCDHFIRARCDMPDLAVWLRVYADTERFRNYIDLNKVSSAGQNTINQGALSQFYLPLPPLKEQKRIISEIDRCHSLVRDVELQVNANLLRAERMRQALLKQAFMGRLVTNEE